MTEGGIAGRPVWRPRSARPAVAASVALLAALCAGCTDCGGGAGPVEVTFTGSNAGATPALVYHGFSGASCARDVVRVGSSGRAGLGDARWQDPDASCTAEELVAFAPHAKPARIPSVVGARRGTGSESEDFAVRFEPLVAVPVRVWYYAETGQEQTQRQLVVDDIERANRWFDELGAGVLLTYNPQTDLRAVTPPATFNVGSIETPPPRSSPAYPAYAMTLGCSQEWTGEAEVRSVSTLYQPATGSGQGSEGAPLNIYYAPFLPHGRGQYCYPYGKPASEHTVANRDVVFVAFDLRMESTLAHEVGHALGLVVPWTMSGHVDEMNLRVPFPGSRGNLMDGGAEDIKNITLGQIFRVHFDALSWLNIRRQPPPGVARDCGERVYEHAPCPALTTRATGWPP